MFFMPKILLRLGFLTLISICIIGNFLLHYTLHPQLVKRIHIFLWCQMNETFHLRQSGYERENCNFFPCLVKIHTNMARLIEVFA